MVMLKCGLEDTVARTHVCQKTLSPVWDCDFRIDVTDDTALQDEPLQLRVFDFDVVTANDIIGSVLLDLNPLLMSDHSSVTGWFPIHDSFRGVCGELHASVKVQFVGDINPFRESSAGVPLYASSQPPSGWRIARIFGLVEELLVESDPDFHWSDSFRTMRSSNESRQLMMFKLNGRLRRLLGHKALDQGANAVLGCLCAVDFDSECLVGRACGTAVTLVKVPIVLFVFCFCFCLCSVFMFCFC